MMKQKQLAPQLKIYKAMKLCSKHFSLVGELSVEVSHTQLNIYSQYAKRKLLYFPLHYILQDK